MPLQLLIRPRHASWEYETATFEAKRLQAGEAGLGRIQGPVRVDAGAAGHRPGRVVLQDQRLGRCANVPGQRQIIHVADDERSPGYQEATRLVSGLGAVKPVPALSGGHHIPSRGIKFSVFSASDPIGNPDASFGVEPTTLVEHGLCRIQPGHDAPVTREASSERAGARAQVHDLLTVQPNVHRGETREELLGEAGPIGGVVSRGPAKVDGHRLHGKHPPKPARGRHRRHSAA